MARDFYPFVEEGGNPCEVKYPARIAVYDDAAAAPRVVVIEPTDPRTFLEQITAEVNRLSHEQGGNIPFTVIREIVENFIHAYFIAPTITILDCGNTIRFSDQGPGIKEKGLALEYGTSSATEEMKHYIRGVGSGLPYAQQYMVDKGGSLEIEDNIAGGTVVTISTRPTTEARGMTKSDMADEVPTMPAQPQMQPQPQPMYQPMYQQPYGYPMPAYQPQMQPQMQPMYQQPFYQPQVPAQPMLTERGQMVMGFLATHDSVGPTDLVQAFGASAPTWSRELASLVSQGLIHKVGQKYRAI